MVNINDSLLNSFLIENNIELNGNYFGVSNLHDEEKLLNHIDLIVEVQRIFMKYHTLKDDSVINEIGRENSKLEIIGRRLTNKYSNIKDHHIEKSLINKFNDTINKLKDEKFKELVRRGNLRDEVCISKLDLTNLRVVHEIEIGKIKRMSFNLIEEDFINYMRKVKKVKDFYFVEKCIDKYIEKAKLNDISKEYIILKLSLQDDCIKYLDKNESFEINFDYLLKIMSRDDLSF